MERKHLDIVRQGFQPDKQTIVVLDIEDHYQFNDPELVEILETSLTEYLSLPSSVLRLHPKFPVILY